MAAPKSRVLDGDPPDLRGLHSEGGARKRIKYTDEMKLILEESFQKSMFPPRETRNALAEVTGISLEQVTVWFQNRRSGRNAAGVIAASLGAAAAKNKDFDVGNGLGMRDRDMVSKEDMLGRAEVKAELMSAEQLRERNGSASTAAATASPSYIKATGSGGGSSTSRGSVASGGGGGGGAEFLRVGGKISGYHDHEQHHHHHQAPHHTLPLPLPQIHPSYHSQPQRLSKHPDLLAGGPGLGAEDPSRHGMSSSPGSELVVVGKGVRSSSPSYGGNRAASLPPSSGSGGAGAMLLSAKLEPENPIGSGPGTSTAFPARVYPMAAGGAMSLARDAAAASSLVGGRPTGQGVTMTGGYQPTMRGRIIAPGMSMGDTRQQLGAVGISGSEMFGASAAAGANAHLLSPTGRLSQGSMGSHRPLIAGMAIGGAGGGRLDVGGTRGAVPPSHHARGSKGGSGLAGGGGGAMRGASSGGKHGDEGAGTQGKNPKFNRLRLTDAQKSLLEVAFAMGAFPPRETRMELSQKTSMTMEQISTWFQNRRMRLKKPEAASAAAASSQAMHKGTGSSIGIVPLTTHNHVSPLLSLPLPPPLNPNHSAHVANHSGNQLLNLNQGLSNNNHLAIVPASSSSPGHADACDDGGGDEAAIMTMSIGAGGAGACSSGERGGGSHAAHTMHSVSSDMQQHGMRERPNPILRVHKTVVGQPATSPIPFWIPTLAQAQAAAAASEEMGVLSSASSATTAAVVAAAAQAASNALKHVPSSDVRITDADMASAPSQHETRLLLLPPPAGGSTTTAISTVIAPPPPSASSSSSALAVLASPSCPDIAGVAPVAAVASPSCPDIAGVAPVAAVKRGEVGPPATEMVIAAPVKSSTMDAFLPSSSGDGTITLFLSSSPSPMLSSALSIDRPSLTLQPLASASTSALSLVPPPSELMLPFESAAAAATDIALVTHTKGGLSGESTGFALALAIRGEDCEMSAAEANTSLPASVNLGVPSPFKDDIRPSPLLSTSLVALDRTLVLSLPVSGIPVARVTLPPVYSASLCSPSLPDLPSCISHTSKSVQQASLSRMSMLEGPLATAGKDITSSGVDGIPPVSPNVNGPSTLVDGSFSAIAPTTAHDPKVESKPSVDDVQSPKNTLCEKEEEEEEEEAPPTIAVPSCDLDTARDMVISESPRGSPSVQKQDLSSPQTVEGVALRIPCMRSPRGHRTTSPDVERDGFAEEGGVMEETTKTAGQETAGEPGGEGEAGDGREMPDGCSPARGSLSPSVQLAHGEPRASPEPPRSSSVVERSGGDGESEEMDITRQGGDSSSVVERNGGNGRRVDTPRRGGDCDLDEHSDGGRRPMHADHVMVAPSVEEAYGGGEIAEDPGATGSGGAKQKQREEEPTSAAVEGGGEEVVVVEVEDDEEKDLAVNGMSPLERRADQEWKDSTKWSGEIRDVQEEEEEEELLSRQGLGDNVLLASKEEELGMESLEGEDAVKGDTDDDDMDVERKMMREASSS